MLALLVSWIFTGWLSLIFGLAATSWLARYLREDILTFRDSKVDYVLIFGFTLVTALASIVTLFSPINAYVTGAFTLVGVYLTYVFLEELKQIQKSLSAGWKALSWPLKLAIFTVFLLSMCSIIIEFGESDIWFYHSQAILWIKQYAVVPGLGNVHGRFAFNSHFFIATALFSFWFSEDYVVFPIMSLFFFLFSTRLLINVQNALTAQRWNHFILNAILLLTCTFQLFPEANGTSTDSISAMFLLYAFLLFLEKSFDDKNISLLVIFWALILTACTFKLSSVFAGVILLFTLPIIFRRKRIPLFLATGLLICLPFVTRNIILSGYLLYPVPQLDLLSVDWKIPMEEVILEKELIAGWAKLPSGGAEIDMMDIPKILAVPFGEWFKQWWPHQSLKWQIIMILNLFTVVLMAVAYSRKNYKLAILCFAIAFNLVFWFLEAPRPRFGFALLFMGLALVMAYSLAPLVKFVKPKSYIYLIFALSMLASTVLKNGVLYTSDYSLSLLVIPQYFQVRSEPVPFKARNFTFNTPPIGPPASGIWCYNLPLPCTPFPKENVEMRGKNYQAGFRVVPESLSSK